MDSLNRLNSAIFRLKKNPELLKDNDNIIKQQLNENIIERVPQDYDVIPGGFIIFSTTQLCEQIKKRPNCE